MGEKALQRAHGIGRLTTKVRDGRTHISTLHQEGCAKIRLPKPQGKALEAVLINTAGGLTGGDEMAWDIEVAPGGRLVVTSQACERVYKSGGVDAKVAVKLSVGVGAHLDWLPQETILFADARLNRTLEVDLADDATFTGLECVLLGRQAMGEAARSALFADRWRVRREGRLVHAEATKLDGSDMARDGLSLLDGASAFGTLVHLGPDAERLGARIAPLLPQDAAIAANAFPGRLVIRALAPSGFALRKLLTVLIAELSSAGSLPRLWTI